MAATQEISDAIAAYQFGRHEGMLAYTDDDITTIRGDYFGLMLPRRTMMGNIMLAYPQYQFVTYWSHSVSTEEAITIAKHYLTQHKMAFNPALMNMIVMNGLRW